MLHVDGKLSNGCAINCTTKKMNEGFAPLAYFTQSEVAKHNRSTDFYVSLHGKVCTECS